MPASDRAVKKRPQLNILIREDQLENLRRLLPLGTRKLVFETLIDEIIQLLESPQGSHYLGMFIRDEITFRDILFLNREKNGDAPATK